MDQTLTLIAAEGRAALDVALVDSLRKTFERLGGESESPVWLAPGVACDVAFSMLDSEQAAAAGWQFFSGKAVDVLAQPTAERRKKLLVADMDSTMVTGETLDELADQVGLKEKVSAITARAMNGELDFKEALDERVGLLKGLSVTALEETWERVVYTPGARTLVQTMKMNGAYTILVSGGFKFFTSRVREDCGFDLDLSNELLVKKKKLTGKVGMPIIDKNVKLDTLIKAAAERKLPLSQTLAVGDGANDLEMIKAAGLGVAFHAKPVVAAQARVRIEHGDLTALLYAQGYRKDEFVS